MKPASTPQRLGEGKEEGKKNLERFSIEMLPFGVTIPATVPQRSEIPEGLMNYSVFDNVPQRSEIPEGLMNHSI
jgi:hypothetical protein